ncbi:flavodoxin family protein [Nocardioides sp. Kera G14]|uniref:flavodoxin family protein n=1 Tax=Nocardioides sp. Kera G14 TaxID=2884264 RepID=UPI001D119F3B|nr:NAD(P)H-dependent oxidoreductase [Nocardioides sp. Kera G14]UDY24842.1 NAD(P)H-dependent oxidoreductase [Nocardioides sp. Kera G14]
MRLLLLHHAPSASLGAITGAVEAGANDDAIEGVEVVVADPLTATAEELLAADGYLLGTAAHFGYMSGALKHLFDRTFLQIGGALDELAADGPSTAGRPFGLWVHGRYDVTGAVRSVESITQALGWRRVAPVLEVLGDPADEQLASAYELGATLAATLVA